MLWILPSSSLDVVAVIRLILVALTMPWIARLLSMKAKFAISWLLNSTAQRHDQMSRTLRNNLHSVPLPSIQPNMAHTHGNAAAARAAAAEKCALLARASGKNPYFVQMSRSDQDADRDGSRVYYWPKDLTAFPKDFHVTQNDLVVLIDVSSYIDMNLFLGGLPGGCALLIYEFQPKTVAGELLDYTWRFNKQDELLVEVKGGGRYQHKLWNYSQDHAVAIDSNSTLVDVGALVVSVALACAIATPPQAFSDFVFLPDYFLAVVLYVLVFLTALHYMFQHVMHRIGTFGGWSVRRVDRISLPNDVHDLILLSPLVSWRSTVLCYLAYQIGFEYFVPLKYYAVAQGNYVVLRTGGPQPIVSIALADGFAHTEVTAARFDALLLTAKNGSTTISPGAVTAHLDVPDKYAEREQMNVLRGYLLEKVARPPDVVYPVGLAVRRVNYEVEIQDDSVNTALTAFSSPLIHEAYSHDVNFARDKRAVNARVMEYRFVGKPDPKQFMFRFAANFMLDYIVTPARRHVGVPLTIDEVKEKQPRPDQWRKLDNAMVEDAYMMNKAAVKREAHGKASAAPRIVVEPIDNARLVASKYYYPFVELFKDKEWCMIGKSPKTIALRVADIATFKPDPDSPLANLDWTKVSGTDITKMDANTRDFFHHILATGFTEYYSPEYHEELLEALSASMYVPTTTKEGVKYDDWSNLISGCIITSLIGLMINVLLAYTALRMTKVNGRFITHEEAVYTLERAFAGMGDDGLMKGIPWETYRKAAEMWGMPVKREDFLEGEPILFLSRYFVLAWQGDPDSCAQPERHLKKWHTTVKLPPGVTPLHKLQQKLLSYSQTDRNSVVFRRLIETYNRISTQRGLPLLPEASPGLAENVKHFCSKEIASYYATPIVADQWPNENTNFWIDDLFQTVLNDFDLPRFNAWASTCKTHEDMLRPPLCLEPLPPVVEYTCLVDGELYRGKTELPVPPSVIPKRRQSKRDKKPLAEMKAGVAKIRDAKAPRPAGKVPKAALPTIILSLMLILSTMLPAATALSNYDKLRGHMINRETVRGYWNRMKDVLYSVEQFALAVEQQVLTDLEDFPGMYDDLKHVLLTGEHLPGYPLPALPDPTPEFDTLNGYRKATNNAYYDPVYGYRKPPAGRGRRLHLTLGPTTSFPVNHSSMPKPKHEKKITERIVASTKSSKPKRAEMKSVQKPSYVPGALHVNLSTATAQYARALTAPSQFPSGVSIPIEPAVPSETYQSYLKDQYAKAGAEGLAAAVINPYAMLVKDLSYYVWGATTAVLSLPTAYWSASDNALDMGEPLITGLTALDINTQPRCPITTDQLATQGVEARVVAAELRFRYTGREDAKSGDVMVGVFPNEDLDFGVCNGSAPTVDALAAAPYTKRLPISREWQSITLNPTRTWHFDYMDAEVGVGMDTPQEVYEGTKFQGTPAWFRLGYKSEAPAAHVLGNCAALSGARMFFCAIGVDADASFEWEAYVLGEAVGDALYYARSRRADPVGMNAVTTVIDRHGDAPTAGPVKQAVARGNGLLSAVVDTIADVSHVVSSAAPKVTEVFERYAPKGTQKLLSFAMKEAQRAITAAPAADAAPALLTAAEELGPLIPFM
jgi:hypothetical protein